MVDPIELERALVWGRSQLPIGGYQQYGRLLAAELDRLRRELAEAQAENASLREIIEASGVDADEMLAAAEGER